MEEGSPATKEIKSVGETTGKSKVSNSPMQHLEKYLMQLVMVKGLSGVQFGLLSYN